MIVEPRTTAHHGRDCRAGVLYLNGTIVGTVAVRGHDGSWGFGEFVPLPGFSTFAPVFGRWSLLMHAEDADDRLSNAASEELRETERVMDAIRAKLRLERPDEWCHIRQLNIDGTLIEWKE